MNEFHVGDKVRIRDDGPKLQRGFQGEVIEVGGQFKDHTVLVYLQPGEDGLYGGPYWFAPNEVEQTSDDD